MKNNRYARVAGLIIGITGLLSQITGCSLPPAATQVADIAAKIATDTAILPSATVTYTPLPTHTITLSPTPTSTHTPRPSLTVTPNQRETILALTDVYEKTVCSRYPDT